MAKGNRRRNRRNRLRSKGISTGISKSIFTGRRSSLGGSSLSRSLHLEQLEDRRLLAVFNVVNNDDLRPDGDGGVEVVPGSLRDALERANEFNDLDLIQFTGLVFEQQVSIQLEQDMGNFGQLDITNPVTIEGLGSSKLSIIAASGKRVFFIDDTEDSPASVNISDVHLIGSGGLSGDDEEGRGGVILNREGLTLDHVEIEGGFAPNGGGAISNEMGSLALTRSLIVDNTSGQGGGGIENGITDQSDDLPFLRVVSSTITGNTASGNGGGVLNSAGYVGIIQSTVYGNQAGVDGGGVASQGFDPELDATTMLPAVYSGNATTTFRSSIIAGNKAPDPMTGDLVLNDVGSIGVIAGDAGATPPTMDMPFDPQINSDGYNLFGVLTHPMMTVHMTVTLPPTGMGDVVGVDPKSIFLDNGDEMDPVAVLGDYGGNTRVFLPDPEKAGGLLAIDHGDPDNVAGNYDQRGRHFGRLDFPVLGRMDIGAAEVQNGTFVVDTLLDESDGEFRRDDLSLREAIAFSEKNPNRDTILFSPDLRVQADPNPFTPAPTIVLTGGELLVTQGVDIQGPTFQLEIDGNQSSRIFNINAGQAASTIDVLVSDLTLMNGGGVVSGGAIFNNENLTLNRSYLHGSFAALNGGALYVQRGDVTVDSSTFFDNNAANNGGGIYVGPDAEFIFVINSTLSENSSSNRGAGLANLGTDTLIKNSTITLNNAAPTRGSGIANLGTGEVGIYSTIVAGNLNTDIEFFGGPITNIRSSGYNLIGVGNAAGIFSGAMAGDTNGVLDPKLAPLGFTGGPTPTHRVEGDSPALDAGEISIPGGTGLPDFDQRGGTQFVRAFDGDLDGTAQVDIGAYELQEVTYTVDSIADENDGNFTMGNLSLREAIEIANTSISPLPETIVFDAMILGSTISLSPAALAPFTTPDIKVTGPVKILGPGMTINGSGLFDAFSGETWPMFTVDDGNDGTSIPVLFEDLSFVNGTDRVVVSKEDVDFDTILATGNQGVVAHSLGTLEIRTSVLTGNASTGDGGAVVVTNGNLIVAGDLAPNAYGYTLITGNSTTASGGNGGGISFSDSVGGNTLSLNKVIISGNQAPAGTADGGGIYISGNGGAVPATQTVATIQDSVISGNSTTGSNSEGAGIFTKDADVTLTGAIISLNKSLGTNSMGGGIFLSGGSLTVENSADSSSLITQNSTYGNSASGGGIANIGGDVTLNQVTISRNTTSGSNTHGAGIFSVGGNLTLNGTTVTQNRSDAAGFNGGGIFSLTNLTGTQKTSIINSTISGNEASFRGGGVFNAGGLMEIKYSTITNNSVPFFGHGGGVASVGNSGTTLTEVRSSIIAGNFSTADTVNPNSDVEAVSGLSNSFTSLGYNVIGKGLPLALNAFTQTGDQASIIDPGLGPLTFNKGPTATHALLPTSPAINAGDPNAVAGVGNVPGVDQQGLNRVQLGRIDVGAFESDLPPALATTAADFDNDNDVDGSDFLAWQRGFGQSSPTAGDANDDGSVNGADLTIWEADYGTGSTVALAAATSGSSFQEILGTPLEPLSSAPVLVESSVGLAEESEEVEASAGSQFLPGLSLSTVDVSLSTATPTLVAMDANATEERDLLFADFAELAVAGDYGDMAFEPFETEELEEDELEFSLEDQVFALLGS